MLLDISVAGLRKMQAGFALHRVLALDLGKHGIRVNSVNLGPCKTSMDQ